MESNSTISPAEQPKLSARLVRTPEENTNEYRGAERGQRSVSLDTAMSATHPSEEVSIKNLELGSAQGVPGVVTLPPEPPLPSETQIQREPNVPAPELVGNQYREPLPRPVSKTTDGNHLQPPPHLRKIQTRARLMELPASQCLVDDLFLENSLIWFVGDSGTCKTFVALELACCIASKQPTFLGQPIRIHGPVVYVIGEGKGRFKYRLMAWEQAHEVKDQHFYFTNGPVNMLDAAEVDELLHDLRAIGAVLIVIDTLSRNFGGEDENSTQKMATFISNCDKLRESGAAVLVIHHTNAAGTRERGNTAGRGAIETQVMFKEQGNDLLGNTVTLQCNKQRDLDFFDDITLGVEIVPIIGEFEASGKQATSCVMTQLSPDEVKVTDVEDEILVYVEAAELTPVPRTKNDIARAIPRRRGAVLEGITKLVEVGKLKEIPGGWGKPTYVVMLSGKHDGYPLYPPLMEPQAVAERTNHGD